LIVEADTAPLFRAEQSKKIAENIMFIIAYETAARIA
jgi:hypothetical protein